MAEVQTDGWSHLVGFYRQLPGERGWGQGPMLEFVSWLAAGPYSRVLLPSTSHASLGLAAVPTYQERLRRPMVYIEYAEHTRFVIHWQRGQGDEVRSERVSSPQAPEVFGRILCWLGGAEPGRAEPGSVLSRGDS